MSEELAPLALAPIKLPPKINLRVPGNLDEVGNEIHSRLDIPNYPFPHEPIEFRIKRELVNLNYKNWVTLIQSYVEKPNSYLTSEMGDYQIGINSYVITPYLEDYKIHLNFKYEYFPFVIDRILEYRYCFPKRFSFKFAEFPLNLNNIGISWNIFPYVNNDLSTFTRNNVNLNSYSTDYKELTNITPAQLKSMPIYQGEMNTYDLDSKMYQYEYLLFPRVVFYVLRKDLQQTLSALLELFPDDKVDEMVQPHDYPRLNIRISKMIYMSDGSADSKIDSIMRKNRQNKVSPFQFTARNNFVMPLEYKEIQNSCKDQTTPKKCKQLNKYSRYFSDHDVCQWDTDTCKESNTYSSHLLLTKKNRDGIQNSIRELFRESGLETLYLEKIKSLDETLDEDESKEAFSHEGSKNKVSKNKGKNRKKVVKVKLKRNTKVKK